MTNRNYKLVKLYLNKIPKFKIKIHKFTNKI